MKVAYFGSDLFMGCLDVFTAHNHEIVAIYTSADKQNNMGISAYAAAQKIPCISDKPTQKHIEALEDEGVECLFSIEYEHLIPLPSSQLKTLNVHPSLLPEGRGATPLSHIILQYAEHAGITFHKLSTHFDKGDIIFQAPIQLDDNEGLESLIVKLHYKIPALLNDVLFDLETLYQNAKPQSGGSYWPKITLQDRLINWQDHIDDIDRMIRAFGRFGVVACVEHEAWVVSHMEVYKTEHNMPPGAQLIQDHKTCVVSITGGIAVIYKNSIIEKCDINQFNYQ